MALSVHPISLMSQVYRRVIPIAHKELQYWKQLANKIPNTELREQALSSIENKTFHCEGGSIMGLAALEQKDIAIQFIVAYQTISDYLDNLCDRSTSLDPADFSALHEAMEDALTIDAPIRAYYRNRDDREDGGYLVELIQTCQSALRKVPNYKTIKPYLLELCKYYCDLQIHKHVRKEEREDRLINWFTEHKTKLPTMGWHEFAACSGSTLGIFCFVSYALREDFEPKHADMIHDGYFPYIQGLHILLDYFIDQEEDREGGDLNFCFYYLDENELADRLIYFFREAITHIKELPDKKFHQLITKGLLGIYLSDRKVNKQQNVKRIAKRVIKKGGLVSAFFYWNGRVYRSFQKK
ncbi:tetraprenyl-beta-curcumene synthase family protein [Sporosarcina sp. CAU 1771]